jgi:hypothetical protein
VSRLPALALPALAAALIGCSPDLSALTVPPVGAVAELDNEEETIELTRGIALGFECKYQGSPCADASAEVEDPGVASVFPAYVDLLAPATTDGRPAGDKPRSVFVLVGNQEGETTLNLSSSDGDVGFTVTIVAR